MLLLNCETKLFDNNIFCCCVFEYSNNVQIYNGKKWYMMEKQ